MRKLSANLQILIYFLIWRTGLFLIAFLSTFFIPNFGARFPYYRELLISTGLPQWVWGFGNFDGVHYITIAQKGYFAQFTQAFFPLYPFFIGLISPGESDLVTGLILNSIFFLGVLFLLYKLFLIDYSKEVSFKTIILILSFPTAFYFGSFYTESLFLLLTVLTIFFARSNNFLFAGVTAAFASATRIYGILLMPFLIAEAYIKFKKNNFKISKGDGLMTLVGILVSPLGTIAYMAYLKLQFNDPLFFLSAQPAFGAERSNQPFVLLPQVLFRYLKILFTVSPLTYPYFTAVMEFMFTLVFIVLLFFSYKRVRKSYWFFSLAGFLLPTLTGTLSSMPRYVLICFLLFPFFVEETKKSFKFIILALMVLQIIFLSLFIQGYWIA
jgi:hypothetical protein